MEFSGWFNQGFFLSWNKHLMAIEEVASTLCCDGACSQLYIIRHSSFLWVNWGFEAGFVLHIFSHIELQKEGV